MKNTVTTRIFYTIRYLQYSQHTLGVMIAREDVGGINILISLSKRKEHHRNKQRVRKTEFWTTTMI